MPRHRSSGSGRHRVHHIDAATHARQPRRKTRYGTFALFVVALTCVQVFVGSNHESTSATTRQAALDSTLLAKWFVKAGTSLTLVSGYNGTTALRITNVTDHALTAVLNDRVNSVGYTQRGATYTASAWMRTSAPGTSVAMRMLEYRGLTNLGGRQGSVWLRDGSWQRPVASYTAASTGSSIDVNGLAWALPAHAWVDVSAITITVRPPVAATPTPPATKASSASPTTPDPTPTPTTSASTPTATTAAPTPTPSTSSPPASSGGH